MRKFPFALIFTFCLSGCGGSDGVETVPVSGVVKLDGKPLPKAGVTFLPQTDDLEAPQSSGVTDEEGRYTLKVTSTGQEGAIIGKHLVVIALAGADEPTDEVVVSPDGAPAVEEPLPARYNTETELSIQINEGGTDKANFDLTSK